MTHCYSDSSLQTISSPRVLAHHFACRAIGALVISQKAFAAPRHDAAGHDKLIERSGAAGEALAKLRALPGEAPMTEQPLYTYEAELEWALDRIGELEREVVQERGKAKRQRSANDLLTLDQAAAHLNTSPSLVLGLVKDGELRCINVGRGKQKRGSDADEDLDEFLEKRQGGAAPCPSTSPTRRHSTGSISGTKVVAFFGSTKRTNRREAEAVERQERERAKREMAANGAMMPLTLDYACGLEWERSGQHAATADDIWRSSQWLLNHFGKDKLLDDIADDEAVAGAVEKRRGRAFQEWQASLQSDGGTALFSSRSSGSPTRPASSQGQVAGEAVAEANRRRARTDR